MPEHDRHHHPGRRESDRRTLLDRIRTVLDTRAFWAGLAFAIIAGLFIFSVVTYSHEQSDRAARRASAQASYAQCLGSIPELRQFEQFVIGVRAVGSVLLLNSIQMHQITKPGTNVYRQQEVNIRRLRRALAKQKGVAVPQFTVADCKSRLQAHG